MRSPALSSRYIARAAARLEAFADLLLRWNARMPASSRSIAARSSGIDLRMDLEDAIASLPKGARLAFVLHDVEGYQHQEIAEQLSVSVGTVKAQLHRARRLLRERLER